MAEICGYRKSLDFYVGKASLGTKITRRLTVRSKSLDFLTVPCRLGATGLQAEISLKKNRKSLDFYVGKAKS